jgi:hypothetical protein
VDYEQFTKIAMIAQGEFRKILLDKMENRKEIFRQIFKTHKFEEIQERIKAETATLFQSFRASKERLNNYASGIVCDGAKASCAGKIALSVEAGILGWEMFKNGKQFYSGEGIITKGVENTIRNVGQLARDGMSETDKEIIRIMLAKK